MVLLVGNGGLDFNGSLKAGGEGGRGRGRGFSVIGEAKGGLLPFCEFEEVLARFGFGLGMSSLGGVGGGRESVDDEREDNELVLEEF